MTVAEPSSAAVLEAIDAVGPPGAPVTTAEVAAEFDCRERRVEEWLRTLEEDGVLGSKRVGTDGRVWWRQLLRRRCTDDEWKVDGSVGRWTWDFETDTVAADAFLAERHDVGVQAVATGVPIETLSTPVHDDDRDRIRRAVNAAIEEGGEFETEYRVREPDGDWLWLLAHGEVEYDDRGEPVRMNGVLADITERKEQERTLKKRLRQQDVVAELGQHALEMEDVDVLMAEAAKLVSETLDADYCKVLDLDDEGEELRLRQGVGWDDGVVGTETVSAVDSDSQAAHTLEASEPVVVEDLETESRFSGPDLLTNHGVRSGISTIVGRTDDPWGILGAHDTARREFTDHDVNFVQSVANTLAAAIRRQRSQDVLHRQRDRLSALNDIDSLVHGLAESMFALSTRDDIEQLVCERLGASDSYEFAWIGTVESGEVVVSTESGVEGYLDDLTLAVEEPPGECGPTVRAHETGTIQVVRDVQDDPRYDAWRDHAAEHGFRASASIPMVDDTHYGTLNVYSSRWDAFHEEERDALRRLGSIIAYALTSVERNRELERERNRLDFMNRLLRHNLLNSLNVVEARLDFLGGRVDYEVNEHLEVAADRTREMVEFVEKIHRVTRAIGREREQTLEATSLRDVLSKRVERTRSTYPEAEFHTASVPDVDVVADDLLGDVFDNVLMNAVQHNTSETPRVRVDASVHDEEVVVSVADNGPGVPDEEKPRVFDRESDEFDDPGTGFGLYLVGEILDSYDGSISVEDNDPEGAVFRVTLQRAS
jgi:signal transduction histidine kinase/PAS domain-containing protein